MQRKILPLSYIDSRAPVHCVCAPVCVCLQMWLFMLLCMCVPPASIPHFVQVISKGMAPNAAIHTSDGDDHIWQWRLGRVGGRETKKRQMLQSRRTKVHDTMQLINSFNYIFTHPFFKTRGQIPGQHLYMFWCDFVTRTILFFYQPLCKKKLHNWWIKVNSCDIFATQRQKCCRHFLLDADWWLHCIIFRSLATAAWH